MTEIPNVTNDKHIFVYKVTSVLYIECISFLLDGQSSHLGEILPRKTMVLSFTIKNTHGKCIISDKSASIVQGLAAIYDIGSVFTLHPTPVNQ